MIFSGPTRPAAVISAARPTRGRVAFSIMTQAQHYV